MRGAGSTGSKRMSRLKLSCRLQKNRSDHRKHTQFFAVCSSLISDRHKENDAHCHTVTDGIARFCSGAQGAYSLTENAFT
jgi:hypothetical protein